MGIGNITPGFQKVKLVARLKTSASQVRQWCEWGVVAESTY